MIKINFPCPFLGMCSNADTRNFSICDSHSDKKDAEVSAFPASVLHWAYLTHQERGLWSIRKIYCEWRAGRNVQGPFWEQLRWAHFFTPGREERPNTPQKRNWLSKPSYITSDVLKFFCKKFDKFTLISAPRKLPVWQSHAEFSLWSEVQSSWTV